MSNETNNDTTSKNDMVLNLNEDKLIDEVLFNNIDITDEDFHIMMDGYDLEYDENIEDFHQFENNVEVDDNIFMIEEKKLIHFDTVLSKLSNSSLDEFIQRCCCIYY